MRIILYLMGLTMISAWLIGLIRFNTGGFVYLVLIIAMLAILLRVTKYVEQRKYKKAMRKRILFLAITGFVAGTLFTSCERKDDADRMDDQQDKIEREQRDVTKEQRDVVEEQTDVDQARLEMDQYKTESELQIKENDDRIREYRTRMDKDPKWRDKYEDDVTDLERKNRDMETRLRDYKYSSKEDWNNFKSEFNKDMDELGTSIKNVFRDDDKRDNDRDRRK
jgi:hypothetical protein